MAELDDQQLLAQFARENSEAAFAELVWRHVNLVYSAALRHAGSAPAAEEVTQAVFIIFARKAVKLPARTVLPAWLYQTARLTAANYIRTETRRHRREQEASMQSQLNEQQADDAWQHIAPLLDDALGRLRERDRNAIVLRFFQNHSLAQVGQALGASEAAVKMRVSRALEKLRRIFAKRGVRLTAAIIAAAVSANSVQAAPAGLAAAVISTAANSAAIGGSVLALVNGALKLMSWMKAKTAVVATTIILATGTTAVVVTKVASDSSGRQAQTLWTGSTLVLHRVGFGGTNEFLHGSGMEKVLGNAIPAKGVKLWKVQLARPQPLTFQAPVGKSWLAAEFKLLGSNLVNHPLASPAFYHEFRCVIRGESGVEFVQEFWPGKFQKYADGYFGYVIASRFPRDSRWLWLRIEQRASQEQGGPWSTVAQFKIENKSKPNIQSWSAEPPPIAKTVGGMDFVMDEITVVTQAYSPRDIWNHVVTTTFRVRSQGAVLTNWDVPYVRVEDASGNWDYNLASHRGLDARYVWKLGADFEQASGFSPGSVATVKLTKASPSVTTNLMNLPVKISWDGSWLEAAMPANRPDLALRFVSVSDDHGVSTAEGSGSWSQFQFRKGDFMTRNGNYVSFDFKPAQLTFAVVPNVHATFYMQPRLVTDQPK